MRNLWRLADWDHQITLVSLTAFHFCKNQEEVKIHKHTKVIWNKRAHPPIKVSGKPRHK